MDTYVFFVNNKWEYINMQIKSYTPCILVSIHTELQDKRTNILENIQYFDISIVFFRE